MLIYEKIRWMNFLSTGNDFTEIVLNKSKSTLILGENGAGKSTVLDALSYALFGKAFRNINKPQLINTINQKGTLVELEFSDKNKHYMVRRGMRPGIFEIYCNGVMVDQESKNLDYQLYLEQQILKMNHKTFKQIVVLGSTNYVPFMQLKANERREVIEDLLDIQVFSVMNNLLKEKISKNKENIQSVEYNLSLINEKINMVKKHIESLKSNTKSVIDQKQSMIEDLNAKISHLSEIQEELNNKVSENLILIKDKEKNKEKLSTILELEKKLENRISKIKKDISFFDEHDHCPTCNQEIDTDFKSCSVKSREEQLEEVKKGLEQLSIEFEKTNQRSNEINQIYSEVTELNNSIRTNNTQIFSWNEFIHNIQIEIEDIKKNDGNIQEEENRLNGYRKEQIKFHEQKEKYLNEKELLDIVYILLKDGGIKTKIVRQFVPIMNKLINKYLSQMDFFIDFTLDEQFNEKIRSRFRDEFSYDSFSEGEKMRINLAILFAWRAITKMRNSISTNLLILDEVFDSSLDAEGTEEFIRIINELAGDTNIFIISHKGDQLYDKFHSVIRFEKVKSFSKMVA